METLPKPEKDLARLKKIIGGEFLATNINTAFADADADDELMSKEEMLDLDRVLRPLTEKMISAIFQRLEKDEKFFYDDEFFFYSMMEYLSSQKASPVFENFHKQLNNGIRITGQEGDWTEGDSIIENKYTVNDGEKDARVLQVRPFENIDEYSINVIIRNGADAFIVKRYSVPADVMHDITLEYGTPCHKSEKSRVDGETPEYALNFPHIRPKRPFRLGKATTRMNIYLCMKPYLVHTRNVKRQ
jgi:hypothetical protein